MKTDERWKDVGEREKAIYRGLDFVTLPQSLKTAAEDKPAKKKMIVPILAGAVLIALIVILLIVLL